jgi:hypothetical protein
MQHEISCFELYFTGLEAPFTVLGGCRRYPAEVLAGKGLPGV